MVEQLLSQISNLLGQALTLLFLWLSIFVPALTPPTLSSPTATEPAPTEFPAAQETPKPVAQKASTTPLSQKPAATPAPAKPTPVPIPTTPAKPQEQVNTDTRAALVNILCLSTVGITGISGSGVMIDPRGVILTNAHIGQYFLLRNYLTPNNIDCVVRTGSPAESRYKATLLFLPPAWVAANASQLKASQAVGTGENDYALLLITSRTDASASLPSNFTYLEMDSTFAHLSEPMLLAAYPAGFLSSELVQKTLYAASAVAYVTQLFTFDDDTSKVDLFSVGGTVVSQGGSSGGAAVRLNSGKLAGILVTATTAVSTGERDLRAVSLSHINNSLAAAGKGSINSFLSGDLSAKAADFNTKIAPGLTAELEAVLKK